MPILHAHRRRTSTQDIHRGIGVRVPCEATVPTGKDRLALSARLVDNSTARARLGRVGRINPDHLSAALLDFVGKEAIEGAPSLMCDSAVEAALAGAPRRHAHDVQVLDNHRSENIGNAPGDLVVPVVSDARDLCADRPRALLRPLASLRPLNPPSDDPLRRSAPPLKFGGVGQAEEPSIGESYGVGHATVDPDSARQRREIQVDSFDSERNMPPDGVEAETDRPNFAKGARVAVPNPAYLGESNLAPTFRHDARLAVASVETETVSLPASAVPGVPRLPTEEASECVVQISERRLLAIDGHLSDPIDLSAKQGQLFRLLDVIQRGSVVPVVGPHAVAVFERQIVHEPAHARVLLKALGLLRRRVEAIAVSAMHTGILVEPTKLARIEDTHAE